MNELVVKVENVNGRLVVSSRVVAEQLRKDHQDVKKKIRDVLKSGTEYFPVQIIVRGKPAEDFMITKDGFVLLCMNYTGYNDFKRSYINKFNEMERQLNSQFKLPQTYLEALEALVEKEKSLLLATQTISEQKPKVDYYDKVLDSESCYTTTQIAKELEMSAKQLNVLLSNLGVQFKQSKQWMLTAKYQDKGYVKTRTHILPNGETSHSTVWTESGRKFLLDLAEEF